jgi:hypothetical protein
MTGRRQKPYLHVREKADLAFDLAYSLIATKNTRQIRFYFTVKSSASDPHWMTLRWSTIPSPFPVLGLGIFSSNQCGS